LIDQPSRTALIAAAHRAVHQSIDAGRVFTDPMALRILGPEAQDFLDQARDDPFRLYWMVHFAGRSQYTEKKAEAAIAKGVRQIVVLGAGYDTFPYRTADADGLRLFEVDHPMTQGDKRKRLAAAGIDVPQRVSFVAVDFEKENFAERLGSEGFDPTRPAFFIWLGVIYYLEEESGFEALRTVSGFPGQVELVFDYINIPSENVSPEVLAMREAMLRQIAQYGEPARNFIETDAMHAALARSGFVEVEDLAPTDIFTRFLGQLPPNINPQRGWHFVHALKPAI
jgi:methyltransferase (TIGR00027 family)